MRNCFSWNYLKHNRASSLAVIVSAFISALLLSLLCSIVYNFWTYEIERLKREEGDWQSRIIGEIQEEELEKLRNFANVEKIVVNKESKSKETEHKQRSSGNNTEISADIYFIRPAAVFKDTPKLATLLEQEPREILYHYSLLSLFFIRDPQDTAPRLIFPFLFSAAAAACISLIMIIHNAFAVSMNTHIRQFGILSSIGATPRQIRNFLLQEAAALCIVPIIAGNALGVWLSRKMLESTNHILEDASGRMDAVWTYHPLIFLVTMFLTIITVWISAWIPARKISRITPLEAIKNTGEYSLKRKNHASFLAFFLGIEGELAGNALKAQKKSLRTATLAMTFSFLAFSLMQCFFTLAQISQRMTYFERYQDSWDIMVTVKNTDLASFTETKDLQSLPGIRSCVLYQKAMAKREIRENELSEELRISGGLYGAAEGNVTAVDKGIDKAWLVNAPLIILDDYGFITYCRQISAEERLDGAVILNQITDRSNPNFRNPVNIPYLNEEQKSSTLQRAVLNEKARRTLLQNTLQNTDEKTSTVPVIAYTTTPPVLKEAYNEPDPYVLVHILPLSLWNKINRQIGGTEDDMYIRILAGKGAELNELKAVENQISALLDQSDEAEIENRIQDKLDNDAMIKGMMLMFGAFCVLLALIGIAGVFSYTLGFVQQRKREIARYLSIGMSPEGIGKLFCIEAVILVGRPAVITLILTIIAVSCMLRIAYLEPILFIQEMPLLPISLFFLTVFAFVALAYYFGVRKVIRGNLAEALRDDTVL